MFEILFSQYRNYPTYEIVLEITAIVFGLLSVWFAKKNKWAARIYINGKLNHIGIFLNEIDASNAYQLALSRII